MTHAMLRPARLCGTPPGGLDLGPISREMALVERELAGAVATADPALREVALHVISAGGKRIRPAMGVAGYLVAGGTRPREVIPLAAAVEMIHTATLLHDDVIDGSAVRRGRPAAHLRYGVQAAIVTGDFLFSAAFGICARYGREIIRIASEACRELAGAEMAQSIPLREMSEELCMDIAARKTGSLMGAGMETAAVLAGAPAGRRERLRRYGRLVGTAFQIIDDCLDFRLDGSTGKVPCADVLSGRATLPLVHAFGRSSGRERRDLESLLSPPADRKKLERLVGLLGRSGSIDYARARAEELCRTAREELRPLRSSPCRRILEDITHFVVERTS
ncbi:MAG: polyprenyl synthetase family protein [Thermoplasmata archaeon]